MLYQLSRSASKYFEEKKRKKMLGVSDCQANWLQSVELAAAVLNN
jgi:hypothetical protein